AAAPCTLPTTNMITGRSSYSARCRCWTTTQRKRSPSAFSPRNARPTQRRSACSLKDACTSKGDGCGSWGHDERLIQVRCFQGPLADVSTIHVALEMDFADGLVGSALRFFESIAHGGDAEDAAAVGDGEAVEVALGAGVKDLDLGDLGCL